MRAPAHDVLMAEVLRLELEAQGGYEGKNVSLTVQTSPCRVKPRKHSPWGSMNWPPMP